MIGQKGICATKKNQAWWTVGEPRRTRDGVSPLCRQCGRPRWLTLFELGSEEGRRWAMRTSRARACQEGRRSRKHQGPEWDWHRAQWETGEVRGEGNGEPAVSQGWGTLQTVWNLVSFPGWWEAIGEYWAEQWHGLCFNKLCLAAVESESKGARTDAGARPVWRL